MDFPSPDEIDERLKRMTRAAQIYRGLYEGKHLNSTNKSMSRLLSATAPYAGAPHAYNGLIAAELIALDLIRFYCLFTNLEDPHFEAKIRSVIGERLTEPSIQQLLSFSQKMNDRFADPNFAGHTGGPFSAAREATGKVWGATGNTIIKRLQQCGYPSTVSELIEATNAVSAGTPAVPRINCDV